MSEEDGPGDRPMHPSDRCTQTVQRGTVSRLFRDETGVTTLEYVVAGIALALAAVAASRVIAGVLVSYLHRIYLVVTLPIP